MYVLPSLRRWGRAGAAVAAGVGLVVTGGGWALWGEVSPWNGAEEWSARGTGLALFALLGGPVIVVQALVVLIGGGPPPVRKSDEALRGLLAEGRPLTLCLDCRTEIVVPPCEHCGQSSSCFEVRSASDADNAKALLGLSSP